MSSRPADRGAKGVMAASLVRDAHTHTHIHAHPHTSRVETVQLSSCCVVLSYAVLPAVLCERSIGPLCSEAHGKQGPVGRSLPRPGMLLCSLVAQPSQGAVRYRSEL